MRSLLYNINAKKVCTTCIEVLLHFYSVFISLMTRIYFISHHVPVERSTSSERLISIGFRGALSHDSLNKCYFRDSSLLPRLKPTGGTDNSCPSWHKKSSHIEKSWREILALNVGSEVEVKHSPTTAKT